MAKFNQHIEIGDAVDPYGAFEKVLTPAAEKNIRIVPVLTDMGFPGVGYWSEHQDRIVQCGIAEQNAAVVAAGLAAEGYIPVIQGFMFANVGRAWNQIRQSILADRFNVKFIMREGIIHMFGLSHATTEGVASCRVLPNLVLLCPVDFTETAKATQAMLDYVGPVVLKYEMGPPPLKIFSDDYEFTIGKGYFIKNGRDATIISTGWMTSQAVQAIDLLEKEGLDVGILHLGTIKPLDNDAIIAAAKESGAIVTAELNSTIGGLGEGVAKVLGENVVAPIRMVGVDDELGQSGGAELIEHYGLRPEDLVAAVKDVVARKS
ncbi:MAG TPA: transketolase C-terminal domain-containing protein [Thermoleophilia bacterium]|nr:transketolase C-terminal domain-containing protein [Thermoleophilia bacterium]